MRIHIKIYLDKNSDQECAGERADYFLSEDSVDSAIASLSDVDNLIRKEKEQDRFEKGTYPFDEEN